MIRLSPELSKIVRIVPSKKMLIGLICNVEYKVIPAKGGSAHGDSPSLVILSDVGQVRGPHDASSTATKTVQSAKVQADAKNKKPLNEILPVIESPNRFYIMDFVSLSSPACAA